MFPLSRILDRAKDALFQTVTTGVEGRADDGTRDDAALAATKIEKRATRPRDGKGPRRLRR